MGRKLGRRGCAGLGPLRRKSSSGGGMQIMVVFHTECSSDLSQYWQSLLETQQNNVHQGHHPLFNTDNTTP